MKSELNPRRGCFQKYDGTSDGCYDLQVEGSGWKIINRVNITYEESSRVIHVSHTLRARIALQSAAGPLVLDFGVFQMRRDDARGDWQSKHMTTSQSVRGRELCKWIGDESCLSQVPNKASKSRSCSMDHITSGIISTRTRSPFSEDPREYAKRAHGPRPGFEMTWKFSLSVNNHVQSSQTKGRNKLIATQSLLRVYCSRFRCWGLGWMSPQAHTWCPVEDK